MLDSGFWILDIGFWILESRIQPLESSLQYQVLFDKPSFVFGRIYLKNFCEANLCKIPKITFWFHRPDRKKQRKSLISKVFFGPPASPRLKFQTNAGSHQCRRPRSNERDFTGADQIDRTFAFCFTGFSKRLLAFWGRGLPAKQRLMRLGLSSRFFGKNECLPSKRTLDF